MHPKGAPRWYWRYTKSDGKKERIPIGPYSATKAAGAFTLPAARAKVASLAALYVAPETRDVRAHRPSISRGSAGRS